MQRSLSSRPRIARCLALACGLLGIACSAMASPLNDAFTYQGRLEMEGEPVSDVCDFQFSLWDAEVGGGQVGSLQSVFGVNVEGGQFAVELNANFEFGSDAFNGEKRWLQIAVKCSTDPGYVALNPRQPLHPAPYAVYAVRPWQSNGNDIYYEDGMVGVGTDTPSFPIHAEIDSPFISRVIYARQANTLDTGYQHGVEGRNDGCFGSGIRGVATTDCGFNYGVWGVHSGDQGTAVYGLASSGSGSGTGVFGWTNGPSGTGVEGRMNSSSGTGAGVHGHTNSDDGYAGYFVGGRNYFGGNVGIGTNEPQAPIHVVKDVGTVKIGADDSFAKARITFEDSSDDDSYIEKLDEGKLRIRVGGPVTRMTITSAGDVGIGTQSPGERLQVNGNIQATGNVFASCGTLSCSDARYKKNLEPLQDALEKLDALQAVSYDWKREDFPEHQFSEERQVGLIAQQVRDVLPEVVHENRDGYLAVDYGRLTPLLVEAVKELSEDVQSKDAQLRAQQAEMNALEARLDRMETLVDRLSGQAESSR